MISGSLLNYLHDIKQLKTMIEAYPLHWPLNKRRTSAANRKRAQFGKQAKKESSFGSYKYKANISLNEATKRVLAELDRFTKVGHKLRVPKESIIISTNIPLRKDGLPRSGCKQPEDPGVAVYFELDGRPYVFSCDKWDRVEDNLAAVAAHSAAMRGIERWGVGEEHDVYTGYKALPETTEAEVDIWEVLRLPGKPENVEVVKIAFRTLSKTRHPDRGGSHEAFAQLNEAYRKALLLFQV